MKSQMSHLLKFLKLNDSLYHTESSTSFNDNDIKWTAVKT